MIKMPRENSRRERVIKLLKQLWNMNPDQRLGQLLENYIFFQGERGDRTSIRLFYQEDEDTETILENILKNE